MSCRAAVLFLCFALAVSAQAPQPTFQAKVNLVMVPVVVRDRDGHAVGNLTREDFQLFDNGRKQVITKFSVAKASLAEGQKPSDEAAAANSVRATESAGPRFVALVFDDRHLHMGGADNFEHGYFIFARDAARRYIGSLNPGDRVAIYATSGRASLDFTSDRGVLEQALLKLRMSQDTAPINAPGVTRLPKRVGQPTDQPFGVFDPHGLQSELESRLTLQELQVMIRRLAGLPGQRILVLLSPGFAIQQNPDWTLVPQTLRVAEIAVSSGVVINAFNVRGLAIEGNGPDEPLFRLTDGTGGAYIRDTNDYDTSLRRLAAPPEYMYLLGFEPDDLKQNGTLHSLKVTLKDSHGLSVQARRGYLDPKPGKDADSDWGAGFAPTMLGSLPVASPLEKELESVAASPAATTAAASLALPFFYRGANVARVNLALDLPPTRFELVKGGAKLRAELAVLGVAYTPAGKVAARFTDKVSYEFDNQQQFDEFASRPLHYERQFDVASGKYNLKVAYRSAKDNFGKVEAPLAVDPWDARQLGLSAIALSHEVRPAPATVALDELLEEGSGPLVYRGLQIVVSGTGTLRQDGLAEAYLEIYEPLLKEEKVDVELRLRLLDAGSGDQKWDSGPVSLASLIEPSKLAIPVAVRLPVATLAPGGYRAEFTVRDSQGRSAVRETRFQLE